MQQSVVPGPGGHWRGGLPALLPLCGRQSSVPYCPSLLHSGQHLCGRWFGIFFRLWSEVVMVDGDVKLPGSLVVKSIVLLESFSMTS